MWKRDKTERNFFDKALNPEPPPAPTFATPSPVVATPPAAPPPGAKSADILVVDPLSDANLARKAAPTVVATSPRGSVLGATLRFKGDLVADEDLVVQGQIEGSVLHSRSITIGPDGAMKGDIRARRIVIEGTATGDLYALECVTVRSTGHLRGNIYAPRVAIAEGAQFNGKVDMAHAPAVPLPTTPAAAPETPSIVGVIASDAARSEIALDDVDVEDLLDGGDKGL